MGVVPWEELADVLDEEVKKPYSRFHLYYLRLLYQEISNIVARKNIPPVTPAEYIANFNYQHKVDYNYLLDEHYRTKKIAWLFTAATIITILLLLMAWTVSLFITKGATFSLLPFMKPLLLPVGEALSHLLFTIGAWEIIGACIQGVLTAIVAGKLAGKLIIAWWPDITSWFRQPPATPLPLPIENGNSDLQTRHDIEFDLEDESDVSVDDTLTPAAIAASDPELLPPSQNCFGLFSSACKQLFGSCFHRNTETHYQQLSTMPTQPVLPKRSPSLPGEM